MSELETVLTPDCAQRGDVRVSWVELGEGWNGEYEEADPEDEELLRFDVERRVGEGWELIEGGSYCTRFPASADAEQRQKALGIILERVYPPAASGESIKKIAAQMSWIEPAWLDDPSIIEA